jgi:hypothetical protein
VVEVDGMFAVFELEVSGSATASQRFRDLWAAHHQTWKDFKKSVDDMSYAALLFQALSVNERAGHFARGLKDWREAFKREGGQPVAAPPNETPRPAEASSPWSTAFIIFAIAAGIGAVGYAARGLRT